jgi:predicted ATPase
VDRDRWSRLSSLFAAALELGPGQRADLLDGAPGDLRREVESLLAAHEADGPFDRLAARMDDLRGEAMATVDTLAASGPPAASRPTLEPGRRLGRHEIRSPLGAGGMGEVYRAFDTRLQREVAIKILGRRGRQRSGALERFEQEARAASALNHPNIVSVYDIGEEASHPYIVMELVDGESLRAVMGAGPCPGELLLHLAVQVADGLVAAHERQIVHGDLKPENVLVTPQGIAKILDFGLARFRREEEEAEEAGAASEGPLLGTPGYLAPEVVAGDMGDLRSDQFSLGAILYEMAAGARAFPGRTPLEALASTLESDVAPLAAARPDLPPAFVQAVTRCLARSPSERHPSTRGLLDDLRAARRSLGLARPGPRRAAALPARRMRLIGRRRELEEIERLLTARDVRLLTLTGPGGTGKTRLALEAAASCAGHFTGGVFFVALAPLADAALVAVTIARAMGAARPSLAAVIADLRSTQSPALLVLDNFEHVLDAAPVVSELLAACPDLSILVTSREGLRLYGEHSFPVSPLELPDPAQIPPPEDLAECPAVALFLERAQAAHPGFRLTAENAAAVAELCARLDGLPLALELAAAQTRVLAPEAMLGRLPHRLQLLTGGARDLPGRQQTLRRTMDWSHQLLDVTEQAVFRRLAAFAGAFTLEAAQAVADPYARLAVPIEEGVAALVNKSLLQPTDPWEGEARFVMLETLREYAHEKLAAGGDEPTTRQAHAAYFLVLAEEGAAALASSDRPRLVKRFEAQHDDFRAALEWLTARGSAEWALRLALGLFHFWQRGEHLAEGRRRLEALLVRDDARAFPTLHARAMFAAGVLAATHGDLGRGIQLHETCLQTYRELGDRWGTVVTLVALGNHYVPGRQFDRARRALEESLRIWRELGDQAGFARSLSNLAYVARSQGRFDESRGLYQQAAAQFERLGDLLSRAWSVNHEGDVARDQADLGSAAALYGAALDAFRALDDEWGIGSSLADLAAVARQEGDHGRAGRLYREALASFVHLDHRRGIARMLESLACLAADAGRARHGIMLAAAASALRARVGAPAAQAVRAELDLGLAAMRRALGGAAARGAWQDGARLSVEEAVELAAQADPPPSRRTEESGPSS